MAITPAQTKELTRLEVELVKYLEKEIDDFLIKYWEEGLTINYPTKNKWRKPVLMAIIERYEGSGWNVSKDGEYLQFKEE